MISLNIKIASNVKNVNRSHQVIVVMMIYIKDAKKKEMKNVILIIINKYQKKIAKLKNVKNKILKNVNKKNLSQNNVKINKKCLEEWVKSFLRKILKRNSMKKLDLV